MNLTTWQWSQMLVERIFYNAVWPIDEQEAVRRFKRAAVQQELARQDLNRSVVQSDS